MGIEKAIDKIAEKFGIVVDWTQDNIYPYVKDIMEKYRTGKIVQDIIIIGILGLLVLLAILTLKQIFTPNRKPFISKEEDDIVSAILITICLLALVFLIPIVIWKICNLIDWIFVPEMQFIKEISKLLK